jgi:drug/metabolite transporter (DMT)-like permease
MKGPRISGDIYALLCAVVCGLGNIPAKIALGSVSTELFTLYFFIFAFIMSVPILFREKERREIAEIELSTVALIFLLAILFAMALYLSMASLKLIEPATVSFLSRFEVIFTVVLAYMLLKEKLTFLELFGGIVALFGVFVLKYRTNIAVSHAATLMIISSLLFGTAEIIVKRNIRKLGTGRFLFYRNLFMIIMFCVIMIIRHQKFYVPEGKILYLIFLAALLLPVLGRATYMEALRRINISRAALITQSTPLFTALFALAILGTYPSATEWLGGGLIICGVIIVQLTEKGKAFFINSAGQRK